MLLVIFSRTKNKLVNLVSKFFQSYFSIAFNNTLGKVAEGQLFFNVKIQHFFPSSKLDF